MSGSGGPGLGDLPNGTGPREATRFHVQVKVLQLVRDLVGGASRGAGVEGGHGESLGEGGV